VDAGPDGERQHLREALDALSDRARMAVLLCHGHGRSVRQVAATMGLSPSGARYLIDRALGFLKRRMVAGHAEDPARAGLATWSP
jgi:RNA polymerase sigma factor (sigma-70 family)